MKKPASVWIAMVMLLSGADAPAAEDTFVNFIRQVQVDSGIEWDVQVAQSGEQLSPLSINPGGARFELWTVNQNTIVTTLLDNKFVGTYIPQAWVAIRTEDPYALIPRTRADRPFHVDVTVNGLLTDDPAAPEPSKKVKLLHHVQSYGDGGVGDGIDRTQATLVGTANVVTNGLHTLTYTVNVIPGANRAKVRGEERFTANSFADYQTPEAQLASQFVQIWPVADALIEGITNGQMVKFALPTTTLTFNDLYPSSRTYAQIYQGNAVLGTAGTIVPGSAVVINGTVPGSRTLTLIDWDDVIPDDGRWTMEIITETPFGVERLAYVTFDLDRTIEINGSVTTRE